MAWLDAKTISKFQDFEEDKKRKFYEKKFSLFLSCNACGRCLM